MWIYLILMDCTLRNSYDFCVMLCLFTAIKNLRFLGKGVQIDTTSMNV